MKHGHADRIALLFILAMSICFVVAMAFFALTIETMTGGVLPAIAIMMLMALPIALYAFMEHLTHDAVRRLYRKERAMMKGDGNDGPGNPEDPFITWMGIIFSKED